MFIEKSVTKHILILFCVSMISACGGEAGKPESNSDSHPSQKQVQQEDCETLSSDDFESFVTSELTDNQKSKLQKACAEITEECVGSIDELLKDRGFVITAQDYFKLIGALY